MTPTNACLDAETLAAWVDGGLSRSDAAMAEAHVSSCPRCQEIAGLIVKTTPVAAVQAPWWRARAAWLVPATAVLAAAGVLIIAPDRPTPRPEPAAATARLESPPAAAAPAAPAVAPPASARERALEPSRQAQAAREKREATDRFRTPAKDEAARPSEKAEEKRRDAPANTSAAAPPAAAAGRTAAEGLARRSLAVAAGKEAVSPDGALHWRITDRGALEQSTDGGRTWTAVSVGISATFTTVQAPAPRTALVTTTDGRVFRTTDGGATWTLVAPKL